MLERHWRHSFPLRFGPHHITRRAIATVILATWYLGILLLQPAQLRGIGNITSIEQLAYSPDGKLLAIRSDSSLIWDVRRQKEVVRLPCDWSGSIQWRPDGKMLACPNYRHGVEVWDTSQWRIVRTLPNTDVDSLAWSPDGQRLGTVASDGVIIMWEGTTGQALWTQPSDSNYSGKGWFLADGRFITQRIVALHPRAELWDINGNTLSFSPPESSEILQVSRNRTLVAFRYSESFNHYKGSIRIWDSTTGRIVSTIRGHNDVINAAAFSPDDSMIVTVAGSSESGVTDITDHVVRVWRVRDGALLREYYSHSGIVNAVDWSPDGRVIVSGSGYVAVNQWAP